MHIVEREELPRYRIAAMDFDRLRPKGIGDNSVRFVHPGVDCVRRLCRSPDMHLAACQAQDGCDHQHPNDDKFEHAFRW